jgi:hypothetical protein
MTAKQTYLCERLKLLGFTQGEQVRLYGLQFELRGDPLVIADNLVLIDAIDRKSGESRRAYSPDDSQHGKCRPSDSCVIPAYR